MNQRSAEQDVIFSILEAVTATDGWGTVCDRLRDYTGVRYVAIFEYDLDHHRVPRFHADRISFPQVADLIEEVMRGDAPEDGDVYEALLHAEPHRFYSEAEVLGVASSDDILSNPFRDRLIARTGSLSRSGGRLNDVGPWMDLIALHTDETDEEAAARLTAPMSFLMPLIGRALESTRVVRGLTDNYATLMTLFDRLDFGAAFCRADGYIVLANRRFGELAAERDGLTTMGQVIGATAPADAARLRVALAGQGGPATTTLTRRSGELPLVVYTARLNEPQVSRAEPMILTLILDPEDQGRLSTRGLAAFNLLSAEELAICDALIRGFRPGEIAEIAGTETALIDTSIDTIKAKMACRTRLDILRLALATNVGVALPGDG